MLVLMYCTSVVCFSAFLYCTLADGTDRDRFRRIGWRGVMAWRRVEGHRRRYLLPASGSQPYTPDKWKRELKHGSLLTYSPSPAAQATRKSRRKTRNRDAYDGRPDRMEPKGVQSGLGVLLPAFFLAMLTNCYWSRAYRSMYHVYIFLLRGGEGGKTGYLVGFLFCAHEFLCLCLLILQ